MDIWLDMIDIPSGNLTVCYWKWPLKSWIFPSNILIFHSYVSLPAGTMRLISFWQCRLKKCGISPFLLVCFCRTWLSPLLLAGLWSFLSQYWYTNLHYTKGILDTTTTKKAILGTAHLKIHEFNMYEKNKCGQLVVRWCFNSRFHHAFQSGGLNPELGLATFPAIQGPCLGTPRLLGQHYLCLFSGCLDILAEFFLPKISEQTGDLRRISFLDTMLPHDTNICPHTMIPMKRNYLCGTCCYCECSNPGMILQGGCLVASDRATSWNSGRWRQHNWVVLLIQCIKLFNAVFFSAYHLIS